MKTIKITHWWELPDNFTGIAEFVKGDKFWYKDGKYHRIDGPAVECANGDKYWYKDGDLHRLDGPAIKWPNGDKEWFKDGREYGRYEDWKEATKFYKTLTESLFLEKGE